MRIAPLLAVLCTGCGTQVIQLLPDGAADATMDGTLEASSDGGGGDSNGDAAPAPGAGKIGCGSVPCSIAMMEYCCLQGGDGGPSETCQTTGGACTGGRIECDEPADCLSMQVCCFEPAQPWVQSSCHVDCTGGGGTRVQACRTQSDCTTGTCQVRACTGGFSIQSCAPIPNVCP